MKKQFVVEIDIPEGTGDLCWDLDDTGLQAFHDCIVSPLNEVNLNWYMIAEKDGNPEFKKFIERQIDVRKSFKVISPEPK